MYYRRTGGCRISADYTYRGLRLLTMENELLRGAFLLDKGADVIQLTYKPLDLDLMWHAPAGVRNPRETLPTKAAPGGSFSDFYPGGWQVIFPAGSGPSRYEGAEFGQHGEAALLAWDCTVLADAPEEVAARLSVEMLRSPFTLERVVRLRRGEAVLHVTERIRNLSGRTLHYMWGQHPAFGAPLVGPGVRLCLPPGRVQCAPGERPHSRVQPGAAGEWPYLPGPDGRPVDLRAPATAPPAAEMLYRVGLTDGWAALVNPAAGVGVGLRWPAGRWPHLWIWQEMGAGQGFPSYGRAYTLALEPFSSLPGTGRAGLEEAIAGGTAALIGPHAEQDVAYLLTAFPVTGPGDVVGIGPGGEVAWA